MESTDYISKTAPNRDEVVRICMDAARERLVTKIAEGEQPHRLADGSLGWTQGLQWGPPFEGDNAFPLIYIAVKAVRVKEEKPQPKPEHLADVMRERDALRAEVESLRQQLRQS